MRRSRRRLLLMIVSVPGIVLALSLLYMLGMSHLEGDPRGFGDALSWTAETVTSTGYGHDNVWHHPVMIGFVVVVQFAGVMLIFLVVPIFLIPFIEERFEGRLARVLPKLSDSVLIYGYGPAVATLMDELQHARIPVVVLEEEESAARRLRDRGVRVVHARLEDDEPDLTKLADARALVLNGEDHNNAVLAMSARQQKFQGPIVALVENPYRRNPMMRAGATAAFTPLHVLAAAIAGKASVKINPRVAGMHKLSSHLEVAELRVHKDSSLAGATLASAEIRERTGATVIGRWVEGELEAQPEPHAAIAPGTILVAAGSHEALFRLGEITRPIKHDGALIVAGFGGVGAKVAQMLTDAGETVRVIDQVQRPGVDVVGDVLDHSALREAGIDGARAVILALGSDSSTLFAATVVRDLAPDVAIIASVNRAGNVERIHRAGADFSLSVSQVAGQLLAHHVIGEDAVSLQPRIKVVKVRPGELAGKNPIECRVRERTGCSIVAVGRGEQVLVDLGASFTLAEDDDVFVCGTQDAVARYFEVFPDARS